ncbi:MAG: Nif3-like dinuclear metal center hexameric protein, partial [Chloroflexi bacterium]|nr:Nif3-like dinuclear metal center hexameric protein [Chloroflexota bacterium]
MRAKEVIETLEREFPSFLSEDWDNNGLQLGPFDEEIKGIAIALNPSLLSIRYALENGFNFLLTHHPLLF